MTDGAHDPTAGPHAVLAGDVVIDLRAHELRRDDVPVHVEPQVFDVIRHLLERAGQLVTKEQLLDDVWGTRFVSESSLTSRIKAARRALGDDGRAQRVIQTVHGRGYRWVAPVEWAQVAARGEAPAARDAAPLGRGLPVALTPFVGRRRELSGLVDDVRAHRLVTATGPGGIGKTRLAVAAAAAMSHELRDGVAFADLVEVTEPAMVVAAVADAAGVPERAGANRRDALHEALARREILLVLDNCEHVLDAARDCVEGLLRSCPGVRVLATSRMRLMLPFERVVAVPGLAVDDAADAHDDDAVELFVARMVSAGATAPDDGDRAAIRHLCRALDGMALAIELAAARVPSLGLDGLAQALDAQLAVLAAARGTEHRHRSLRAAIDWTYRLLADDERAALRAAAVFAGPFEPGSLAAVLDQPGAVTLDALGRLVDWNLVSPQVGTVRRYRVLETIRQFADEEADRHGDAAPLRLAHAAWARATVARLLTDDAADGDDEQRWCEEVDDVLPEARAAVRWLLDRPTSHDTAALAEALASLLFRRGHPGEAQLRFEEAASAATDHADRRRSLHSAAGAAAARNVGREALALLERAAAEAEEGGHPDEAAQDLATMAMYCRRAPGIIDGPVDDTVTQAYVARAHDLSTGATASSAAIAIADAWAPAAVARSRQAAEHALAAATAHGDPLMISGALDLVVVATMRDDMAVAADAANARLALLADVPVDALGGFEHYDAIHVACHLALARGELALARQHADAVTELPYFREARHLGVGRRMEVDAMAGAFHDAVRLGALFERDWERAGRPRASNLAVGCHAVAMVHGILGDDEQRARWLDITRALLVDEKRSQLHEAGWAPTLDAIVELHHDRPARALARLTFLPDDDVAWGNANRELWRAWYGAIWLEAAVLAGSPDVDERVTRARPAAAGNRIAAVLVERALHVHAHDAEAVGATSAALAAAGCSYQAERSLVLAELVR